VWRVQNYLCPLVFCFWSSSLEWGEGGGFFRPLVLLYVSAFCLWGGCVSFLVLWVVAGFLGVVVGWVGLMSLCSLPFLRGLLASLDSFRINTQLNVFPFLFS